MIFSFSPAVLFHARCGLFAYALLLGCASSADRDSAPEDSAPHADCVLQRGIAAAQAGELELAVSELQSALALAPADARELRVEAERWLGHVHMLRRAPDDALPAFERAVALDPADAWLRYAQGTALQELGRYEEAIAAYSRALQLDPRHLKALQWRGEAQALLGRHRAAADDFTRALELLAWSDSDDLASWGGDRDELVRWTLNARRRALEALGERDAAERDRAALEQLDSNRTAER